MRTRAAVLYEMGKPRPYAESRPLRIEEVELEGPGPGEVLVQIAAAGVCHSDLSVVDGTRPRVTPMVLGHEASGIVREVGPGVKDLKPGDHVVFSYVPMCGVCVACAIGRPVLCERGTKANAEGRLLSGHRRFKNLAGVTLNHHLGVSAFSEYTVVAQESLVKIDSNIPLDVAALFGCAVLTGAGAVINTAKVTVGASVAIFGLGGVGLSAVIGARAAGAYPIIAIDLVDEKLEIALRLGASHVVNASKDDPVDAIRNITKNGVQYAFESVGNEKVLEQAWKSTARGGTTVAIGLPHPSKRLSISPVTLVAEERTLKGSYMGSTVPKRDLPRFIALYKAGVFPVDLLVSRTLRLNGINAALDALANGEVARQVIRFDL